MSAQTITDVVAREWRERSGVSRVRTLGWLGSELLGAAVTSVIIGPAALAAEVLR